MVILDKIIGKVLEVTDLNNISFVSTKYFSTRFIKILMDHVDKDIFLIGEVLSIQAVNPYFEKPRTIRYVEENDESLSSQSVFISKLRILAFLKNDTIIQLNFPPLPGKNVLIATKSEIEIALGLQKEGMCIGQLKDGNSYKIKLSSTRLLRTHFSILGRTGSGKSYFTKGLMKKLSKEIQYIVFSPSEEYNQLADDNSCIVYKNSQITFPFEMSYLTMIYGFNLREQLIMEKFFKEINNKNITITSQEIQKQFKDWFLKKELAKQSKSLFADQEDIVTQKELPQYGDTIITKIRQKDVIFSKSALKIPFNGSVVFDMSALSQEIQELVITYVLHNLLYSYKKSLGKKTLIVIEEAHNYAPSVQTTACKEKIVQIAREGRKLGISLCLISQRPRHIDQTILSQAGTLILFNIPHPDDVQHVLGVSPIYNTELPETVRKLGVGECLIIGDVVQHPIECKVDFKD